MPPRILAALAATLISLAGTAQEQALPAPVSHFLTLEGQATYRQRSALPPDAVFHLTARDGRRVLAELDVGKAYPFVALGIVVTMASGALFLGESVPMLRVVGAALVIVGVILVGMS